MMQKPTCTHILHEDRVFRISNSINTSFYQIFRALSHHGKTINICFGISTVFRSTLNHNNSATKFHIENIYKAQLIDLHGFFHFFQVLNYILRFDYFNPYLSIITQCMISFYRYKLGAKIRVTLR